MHRFSVWRTDLRSTVHYWKGWFTGMDDRFLNLKEGKVLILADTASLDRRLTIAQMQGKIQLHILAKSGHVIQEDQSTEVANILRNIVSRLRQWQIYRARLSQKP